MAETLTTSINSDLTLIKLAREIAMDILPFETILNNHGISDETWAELQRNTRFRLLLESEVEAWGTSLNTHERVKVKAASMLEEWLPELNYRINDRGENLPAVIEAGKMLSRVAGIGLPDQYNGPTGERFVVTINLGPQVAPLEFTKEVTSKVIDHEGD